MNEAPTQTEAEEYTTLLEPIIKLAESGESAVIDAILAVNAKYGMKAVSISHGQGIPDEWKHHQVAVFRRQKTILRYSQIVAHKADSAVKIWKKSGKLITPYVKIILSEKLESHVNEREPIDLRHAVSNADLQLAIEAARSMLQWQEVEVLATKYLSDRKIEAVFGVVNV